VTDGGNSTIRKITPAGTVSTLAGAAGSRGSEDGTVSAARFAVPQGVAVDTAGNVYVGDRGNNTIRKITPLGIVSTLAGVAGSAGSTDGAGNAARFFVPRGVAVDTAGNVYVADSGNHTIRKISPAGNVSTLAGLAGSPGFTDGTGSAARFSAPAGVAVDTVGNVYVGTRTTNHPEDLAAGR
jgi:sugar lactone lactonase YvrE